MDTQTMTILATANPSRAQLAGLSGEQLAGLSGEQLAWLSGAQLAWLSGAQLAWLSREQLAGLSGAQLAGLSGAQLAGLSGAQLAWLSGAQLAWLSGEQLAWLSDEQLAALSAPKVEQLYTKIFSHTQAKLRLDQSTFGEDNRGKPVCETPMCIGGTTVWLAGEEGYKLADRVGFSAAAGLIHLASCPDIPMPRYDNYPDEWAMAFIEWAAEREAAA